MSFELMRQVWELDLSRPQQHILLAMANFANDEGLRCYPSQARLSWMTGYKERQIVVLIQALVESGIVEVLKPATNKHPPHYRICLENGNRKPPLRDAEIASQEASRDAEIAPQEARGAEIAPPGVQKTTAWGAKIAPDPVIDPVIYNQSQNGIVPFAETAPEKANSPEAETAQIWALLRPEFCSGRPFMEQCLLGSELLWTGEQRDDKPLYRLLVVKADNMKWLQQQAAGAITSRLRVILGKRVALDVVAELEATP